MMAFKQRKQKIDISQGRIKKKRGVKKEKKRERETHTHTHTKRHDREKQIKSRMKTSTVLYITLKAKLHN